MNDQLLQEFFILASGQAASAQTLAALRPYLDANGDHSRLDLVVDVYFNSVAAQIGNAKTLAAIARNGLGAQLTEAQSADIYKELVGAGINTWSKLFTWLSALEGPIGDILTNRGLAATYLVDQLSKAGKSDYFAGAGVGTAIKGVLENIGASANSLSNGKQGMAALAANLTAAGIKGAVVDGYVKAATVFADANGDGVLNPGEWSTTTDANGAYVLPSDVVTGSIVAYGGIDVMTGKDFQGVLTAPSGSTVVNPLTTLVQAMLGSGQSLNVEQATATVQKVLGLPDSIDLLSYDPLAVLSSSSASEQSKTAALAVQSTALQVANIVTQAASAIDAASASASLQTAAVSVSNALAAAVSKSASNATSPQLNLSSKTALSGIVSSAALAAGATQLAAHADQLAEVTSASNSAAASATDITALAKVAVVAQGAATEALKSAATQNDLSTAVSGFTAAALDKAVSTAAPEWIAPNTPLPAPKPVPSPSPTPTPIPAPSPAPSPSPTGNAESALTVLLDSTPGSSAAPTAYSATGTASTFVDDASITSHAVISGFGSNDAIAMTPWAESYLSVSSQGTDVQLTLNRSGLISSIKLLGIVNSGQIIFDVNSFNALPVGDITFNGAQMLQSSSLDSRGGSLSAPATANASIGQYAYTDDALISSAVNVTGFGANDSLTFLNASAADLSISSQGTSVSLVINKEGVVSSVTLVGVLPTGGLVYDVSSFNALPVGDVSFQ